MRQRPNGGPGTNILLIGTDDRTGDAERRATNPERRTTNPAHRTANPERRTANPAHHAGAAARTECDCATALTLLHVSKDHDRLSIVALPPTRTARLAPAPGAGGMPPAVRAVEDLTHVRVDRYAVVDAPRLTSIVDALHGVEVCTARPLRDAAVGLDLRPGRHLLTGAQALRYVRAREPGAAGEAGRALRRQHLVVAVLRRLRTEHVLDAPVRVARLGRVLLGDVLGDAHGTGRLTVPELVTLAGALRQVGPDGTELASVPAATDRPGATALFARLRTDRPLTPTAPNARPGSALNCP